MQKAKKLEKAYQEFTYNLNKYLPDGIVKIDLPLLKQFNLLNKTPEEEKELQDQLPFYFHVIEHQDKVTLFNNQFVVWIVPKIVDEMPLTLTLIALVAKDNVHLEIGFSTFGAYNTPKYVLKVLRHFLSEVIDTEAEISAIVI